MKVRKITEAPRVTDIHKSTYELQEIRERLSGAAESGMQITSADDMWRVILSLSNEIAGLKEEVAELKGKK